MRTRILTVLATLLLFTLTAHADTKSWTATKAKVPPGTQVIVGIDLTQLAKTAVYQQVVQKVLAEDSGVKQGFDAIQKGCGIDVTTAITDVTIYAIVEPKESVLVALGVNGVDKAKLTACMQSIADLEGKGAKITAKTKGKVTEYSMAGKADKFYVAWLTKDVLAVTDDLDVKGKLEKMLAGKAAKGDLKANLARVTTTSPLWAAMATKQPMPNVGTFTGAFGTVDLAASTFSGSAHIVMSSADEATKFSAGATSELKKAQTELAKKAPDFAAVLAGVKATTAGAEVTFTGAMTEKQLINLLPMFIKEL